MASENKDEMAKFNEGDRVVVPYGREMVRGRIVRYDAPGMFYVVDIGKYESIKVAQEDVRKAHFSRPGAPDTFAVEDRFYFGKGRKERFAENVTYSVAAMIGSDPVGHRSARSVEEAKAYAKQMLESFKSQARGKPVLVEVYPVVNTEPKDAILVLRG